MVLINQQGLKSTPAHKDSQHHLSSQTTTRCEDLYSTLSSFIHTARMRRYRARTRQEVGLAHGPSVQVAPHRPARPHPPHPAAQCPLLHTMAALSAPAGCRHSHGWPQNDMAADIQSHSSSCLDFERVTKM